MNSFKRKALTCAVLAGLGGVATTAEAVYRNPDGTGMVLIYPYYTVQAAGGAAGTGASYSTYISVTNTTSQAKVAKVRFREGRTSAEVLDFNIYLSPNDVWVGGVGVFGGSTAADAPAAIFGNFELSCTHPQIPVGGEPFKNTAYIGNIDALPGTGLDRTREGYVEIFDMATLTGVAATNVTHTGIGIPPPNCSAMMTNLAASATFAPLLSSPTGGLYGEGTIINVSNGASMGYKADALDAYRSVQYYADVSSVAPQLGAQAAPFSLVMANNRAVTDVWALGREAVAAVFMHTNVMNDYILESGNRSATDWVLTFPGKHEFFSTTGTPVAPYTAVLTTTGACEPVLFTFFDRDEQFSTPSQGGFSPQAGATGGPTASSLCWESTVVSIRNSSPTTTTQDINTSTPVSGVLGSRNVRAVAQTAPSFNSGWINLLFTGANATTGIVAASGGTLFAAGVQNVIPTAAQPFGPATGPTGLFTPLAAPGHRFFGLPVTGFMVTNRGNAAVPCGPGITGNCTGNYPALFVHSYRTTITP